MTAPLVVFMYTMPFGHLATNYVMFALATLVQFVSGRSFYEGAYHSLKNRSTNMDVLIALGSLRRHTFTASIRSFLSIPTPTHFSTAPQC